MVVVDFWATWCQPCTESFPHMVQMSHQFPKEQVVFLSLSIDELDNQEKVEKFLNDVGAYEIQNLLTKLGGQPSVDAFDLSAGVPCYKLYGRQGKLRYQFAAQADSRLKILELSEFDAKLREVLAE